MLSASSISSAAGASSYFSKDDYYTHDSPPSAWIGKGAEEIGFEGEVTPEQFEKLLKGELPDGQKLGTMRDGEWQHRPGVDLTFSAPKSVSIQAEIGKDERLIEAHDRAVTAAMAKIEERAAITRIREGGEVKAENTGKFVVAQFRHDMSREQDPQLHTHNVVMNMTKSEDGKWRSLDNKEIFRMQKEGGLIYRQELAKEVQQLGYEIQGEKMGSKGEWTFTIKGVDEKVQEHFSSRSAQIEKELEKKGLDRTTASAAQKEVATLSTRQAKDTSIDREAVRDGWIKQAKELGHNAENLKNVAEIRSENEQYQNDLVKDAVVSAKDAVQWSVNHISEREAIFSKQELAEVAYAKADGAATVEGIDKAIKNEMERGSIIAREASDRGVAVEGYTTRREINYERSNIKAIARGAGKVDAIAKPNKLDRLQGVKTEEQKAENLVNKAVSESEKQGHKWTAGQKMATKALLMSKNRIVAIQGAAGSAKTSTVIRTYAAEVQRQGGKVIGMAPTNTAAAGMQTGAGIDDTKSVARHMIDLKIKAKEIEQLKQKSEKVVDKESRDAPEAASGSSINNNNNDLISQQDGREQQQDNALAPNYSNNNKEMEAKTDRQEGGNDAKKGAGKAMAKAMVKQKINFNNNNKHKNGEGQQKSNNWDKYKQKKEGAKIATKQAIKNVKNTDKVAKEVENLDKKQVWIVDEAGMMSNKQMMDLTQAAEKADARVVLVGDTQQLSSVGAGRAFEQMQNKGEMETYRLDEIVRQSNEQLKDAVNDAYRGGADKALEKIEKEGGVKEIQNPEPEKTEEGVVTKAGGREEGLFLRAKAIATDYAKLEKDERKETIIIAPGHDDRKAINDAVRNALKNQGELQGRGVYSQTLQAKSLTAAEKVDVRSYEKGDIVRFGRDLQKLGVKNGEYAKIVDQNKDTKTITLQRADGENVKWRPEQRGSGAGKTEAFTTNKRGFAKGDKIIFNRNNKDLGVNNKSTGEVAKVEGTILTVKTDSGKTVEMDLKDQKNQHIDHGYAQTAHAAQGATADRVMIHAESHRENLTNQRALYVGISRAREQATIYTDDFAKLKGAVMERTGENTAAMDPSAVNKGQEKQEDKQQEDKQQGNESSAKNLAGEQIKDGQTTAASKKDSVSKTDAGNAEKNKETKTESYDIDR